MKSEEDIQFTKVVAISVLTDYGIRMESSELKMLTEQKMDIEISIARWNQVVKEISQMSGMIIQ